MPTFNLSKGASFNLQKSINLLTAEAGWDPATKPGETFDLDLWCFALSHQASGPKLFDDSAHIVGYFNTPLKQKDGSFVSPDGSIIHSGDDRTGVKSGVDESISVNLSKLPQGIDEIQFYISIHEAAVRNQNFGRVSNAFIRIVNADTKEVLCSYSFDKEFPSSSVVQVGSLINNNGAWSFKAVGAGSPDNNASINTVLGNF